MASGSSLTALPSAAVVEETLLRETERGIVLRFGRTADPLTRRADAQLRGVAQRSDEDVGEVRARGAQRRDLRLEAKAGVELQHAAAPEAEY